MLILQLEKQKRDAERKPKKVFRGPGASGDLTAAFDPDHAHAASGTLQSETLEWLRDAQEALKRDVSLDVVEDLLVDGEAICARFGLAVHSNISAASSTGSLLDSSCKSTAAVAARDIQYPVAKRRRVENISEVRCSRKGLGRGKRGKASRARRC